MHILACLYEVNILINTPILDFAYIPLTGFIWGGTHADFAHLMEIDYTQVAKPKIHVNFKVSPRRWRPH